MRNPAQPTFPITITRDGGPPLPEQIAAQVCAAMTHGLVADDGRLPSTRTLAEFLGVSRGVAAAAYDLLGARGYLESRPGSGAYARRDAERRRPEPSTPPAATPDRQTGPGPIDLRPVAGNAELFPVSEWRAAWRDATFRPPPVDAPPPLGLPELREAVAEHLLAELGLRLTNRTVLITTGPAHGLRAVLGLLGLRPGHVALAEPVPALLQGFGSPAALGVDDDGACVQAVPPGCRAIVVGADARAPLGRLMTMPRRAQAARWARRAGGVVIDVAADTGLARPARRLPRLLDVLGDDGVLLGGFGDSWGAALEIGFAVLPRHLAEPPERRPSEPGRSPSHPAQPGAASAYRGQPGTEPLYRGQPGTEPSYLGQPGTGPSYRGLPGTGASYLGEPGAGPSYLAQRAMATLLRDGSVERFARRLDRLAVQRGRLVRAALDGLPGIRYDGANPPGIAALHLPQEVDAAAVAGDLLARGVHVETSAARYFSRHPVPPALLFGYLRPSGAELRRALGILRGTLSHARYRRTTAGGVHPANDVHHDAPHDQVRA